MDWDRKWIVDFKSRKTQLLLSDHPNNTSAIDVKMDSTDVPCKIKGGVESMIKGQLKCTI